MSTKFRIIVNVLTVLVMPSVVFSNGLVMFNHQGRVRVQGTPFDGTGYFKFAIVNNPGTITIWSNDGTSVNGSEPVASISVQVTDGIFNVMVGDPGLAAVALQKPSSPGKLLPGSIWIC